MNHGQWIVNTAAAFGQDGRWTTWVASVGGGGGGGGGNNAINRSFPSPNSRLWTTYAARAFPLP